MTYMHGNVWEWCKDASGYGSQYVLGRVSLLDDYYRSLRGGSWATLPELTRSGYRNFGNPLVRRDNVGLRLALAAVN